MGKIIQVERSAMVRIVGWMKEIIKDENLPFSIDADIELDIHGKKRKFPDILVFVKYPIEIACIIEYKPPTPFDPYDPELVDNTYNEACNAPGNFNGTVRYFGTWNTNKFVLWDRKNYDAQSYLNMRLKPYEVVEVRTIEDITRPSVEETIKKFLKIFFKDLHALYFEAKPLPTLPIDEFFVYRLRTAIDSFYIPISVKIQQETKDPKFKKALRKWFHEQSWMFTDSLEDFDRTARQYTYIMVDKILFYNALRIHKPELDEIKLSKNLNADKFKNKIQKYFDQALDIDYEPIFEANFIEKIPIPDYIVPPLVSFINSLNVKYNFATIGYDVIGRVFENLIPPKERHTLGQYFTRSDVVDLINNFCIRNSDDIIMDPGCGAGTFLTRAYTLIKQTSPKKNHEKLLSQLYGIDISKFASHLSMINLSIRDLSEEESYPKIINKDLFDVYPEKTIPKKHKVKKLTGKFAEITIPHVTAIVGNPPYTRQEEMEDISEYLYKDKIKRVLKQDWGFEIGKRAGIYVHFFIHGAKFLKQNGRLGFITSNSWLDTDYGKHLQKFFLNKFKIIAIIESKVERWFEDADINTCITILERNDNTTENDNNQIKFVQLKQSLSHFIPQSESYKDDKNHEFKRIEAIHNLISMIYNKSDYFEDGNIRIFPKLQKELWEEGFNEDQNEYVGSKWGKYLRAPDIFFKIIKKCKDKFVPLKTIGQVRFGIKTGANEFFYLKEKDIEKIGIEKEYFMNKYKEELRPNYVITSPKDSNMIVIDPKKLKYRVLMIHKDKNHLAKTNILKFIKLGEEKAYNKRPTCSSRNLWYDLGDREPGVLLWQMIHFTRHTAYLNPNKAYVDHNLFEILNLKNPKLYCAILNSTLYAMFKEIFGRVNLGQGSLKNEGIDIKIFPMPDPRLLDEKIEEKLLAAFEKITERTICNVFEEIGANKPEDVKLEKVKEDRLLLDEVLFELLNLSKNDLKEVYRAVIDIVSSRLTKAQSTSKKNKKKGINIEAFTNSILNDVDSGDLKKFPEEYVNVSDYRGLTIEGEGEPFIDSNLFDGLHVRIGEEIIKCNSEYEAKYIYYSILNGNRTIKLPKDGILLKRAVDTYNSIFENLKNKINEILKDSIPDKKLRERINIAVWKKLLKGSQPVS